MGAAHTTRPYRALRRSYRRKRKRPRKAIFGKASWRPTEEGGARAFRLASRSVYDAAIIQFLRILDDRGNLTFIESRRHLPFDIARVYWIYDVPGGESRGSHAYRTLHEVIIALSGGFEVFLDDGLAQKTVMLNRAYYGLYVPNLIRRRMQHFSTNAVALVLASKSYDLNDYVRDYEEFQRVNQRT